MTDLSYINLNIKTKNKLGQDFHSRFRLQTLFDLGSEILIN